MEQKERWTVCKYITESGDIIEFPNYMVSDQGRVKSLNYRGTGEEKVLNQCARLCNDNAIVYKVGLYKEGKSYVLPVHRLILSSFDPTGFQIGYIVNHKSERTPTTCDNRLSNLEWITIQQNSTDHTKAVLSEIRTNRKDLSKPVRVTFQDGTQKIFPSAKEAGRSLGICPYTPSRCINSNDGYYKKLDLHFAYV